MRRVRRRIELECEGQRPKRDGLERKPAPTFRAGVKVSRSGIGRGCGAAAEVGTASAWGWRLEEWLAGLKPGAYIRAEEQHGGSLGMTVTRVLKLGVRIGHVA
jgi:hypothetical protein